MALLVHAGWAAAVAVAGARGPRLGALALLALAPLELALPTLVPLGHPGSGLLRILLAIHCGVSWIKACELHLARRRSGYPSGWSAWTWLLWVRPDNHVYSRRGVGEPRPPRACLRGLALGVALLAAGLPTLIWAFGADLGRLGFWPDHLTKFAAAYTVLMGVERVGNASVNLLGIPAHPVLRDPAFAYSPADFWQRWNQPVNLLLWTLVFRRWGRRAPLGALLVTFLISG
ncbi:MAG: hypothetical protein KDD82_20495, partial [Planctomycetes bacterium]|nr:hypothetical protein [Planctomycetota bacterium]